MMKNMSSLTKVYVLGAILIIYGAILLLNPTLVAPAFNDNVPPGTPSLLPLLAAARPELRLILFARTGADAEVLRGRVNAEPALRGRAEVKLLRELPTTTADVFWYPWNAIITKARVGAMVVTLHDVAVGGVTGDDRTARAAFTASATTDRSGWDFAAQEFEVQLRKNPVMYGFTASLIVAILYFLLLIILGWWKIVSRH